MKTLRRISNLLIMNKCGGLLFCTECKFIIGYINSKGYKRLELAVNCNCGGVGDLLLIKLGEDTANNLIASDMAPDKVSGVCVCTKCAMPMFWIDESRISNYSFNVVCECGIFYDRKSRFKNRLGETIRRLKDSENDLK